jgi:hypothetical protein
MFDGIKPGSRVTILVPYDTHLVDTGELEAPEDGVRPRELPEMTRRRLDVER